MTRRHPAITIYKKELLDTLRDRRTLAAMLLVPMVAYPVALLVTSETMAVERRAQERRDAHIAVLTPMPEHLIGRFERFERVDLELVPTASATREQAIRESLAGGADLVVAMTATNALAFDGLGTGAVELYYDATRPFGDAGLSRVESMLGAFNDEVRAERMRAHGLPASAADPLRIRAISLASDEQIQNQLLGSLLPALVLLFIAISCFYPAVDLTAGEKERRTLATLLTAPVRIRDVVLGKYLAVVTIGTFAGLLNVTTLSLTLLRVFTSDPAFGPIHFQFTASTGLGIAVSVVAIAAPLAAVMLLFACLARSFRDASYLLTPVLLVAAIPAMLSAMPTFVLTPKLAAIPLANAALLLKATFVGDAPLGAGAIVLVVAAATTLGLLSMVERVFADERVLFSTTGPRADLRSLLETPPTPGVETALVVAAVVFVLDYYFGLFTTAMHPLAQVAVMQFVCHLGVALVIARWMKRHIRASDLLGSRWFDGRAAIAAILLGGGAWLGLSLPSAWLTAAIFPGQSEAAAAFSAALDLSNVPVWVLVVALAIVPALCEELLFRGVIQRLIAASAGEVRAVWIQAIVFGLFHGSVYRLLPTFLLGLALGELRRRTRSVWPGVVTHVMTNATLLLLDRGAPAEVMETLTNPTFWALAGLALVAVAHLFVDSGQTDRVNLA